MEEETRLQQEVDVLKLITEFVLQNELTPDVYSRMLAGLLSTLDLDIGTLQIIDEENNVLRLVAARGVPEDRLIPELPLDDPENLGASVARTGEPIFVLDAPAEDLPESRLEIIRELKIRTLVFWPIKGGNGKLLGVVNLASHTKKPLETEGKRLFESIAQAFGALIEHQQSLRALRKSEEKCRMLVENSIQGIAIAKGTPLRFVYANPALCSMIGYSRDELLSLRDEGIRNTVHPDDREWYFSRFEQHLTGEIGPSRSTVRVITRNGEIRWWELAATRIHYEGGPAVLGTFIDTTERRLYIQALRDSERRYRLLADNIKDVIWILSLDMKLDYVSPSVEEVFGYTPEEVLNNPISTFMTPESTGIIAKEIRKMRVINEEVGRKGYDAPPLELEAERHDGSLIWIEVTRTFIRDEKDRPTAVVGVARDITRRKNTENELQMAKRTAEFYNDILAHDLANIQQGIIASLELMKLRNVPDDVRQLVDTAFLLTRRGILLTTNVKRLAQLRGATVTLHPVCPHKMLTRAAETASESFPNKQLEVVADFKPGEYIVIADRFLEDVFYNLLHNAVRFDPEATVRIEARAKPRGAETLSIAIEDSGQGIPDKEKEDILVSIGDRKGARHGIGLTLVKRIIDRYSGRIWIEDRVNGDHTKGTRFVIELPMRSRSTHPKQVEPT